MKKQKWRGQTVLFPTQLFGKNYVWLQDIEGTIYLARAILTDEGFEPELL